MKRTGQIYPQPTSTPPTSGNDRKTPGLVVRYRDLCIFEELWHAGYMSTRQIGEIHFRTHSSSPMGWIKAAERRVRQLVAGGILRIIRQQVKQGIGPYHHIIALDEKGAQILSQRQGIHPKEIDWKQKKDEANYPFLYHLLETTDLKIALLRACEQQNHTFLDTWLFERQLRADGMADYVTLPTLQGKTQRVAVIPDAIFVLKWGERTSLSFVEIDRRTVSVEPTSLEKRGWVSKFQAFLHFFQSDGYKERYSVYFAKKSPDALPLARVLVLTTGPRRRDHLKATAEKVIAAAGAERFYPWFWFTTTAEATDPTRLLTEPIFYQAGQDAPVALLPKELQR